MVDPEPRVISTRRDIARTAAASLVAGLGYALLGYLCVEIPRAYNQVTPIWLSNGFVVACLLAVDTRRWFWMLSAAMAGGLMAGLHAGDSVAINFVLTPSNIFQVWACAWSVRRVLGRHIDLGRPRDMITFVGLAGFLVPAVSGAASALYHTATRGGDLWGNLAVWVLGDILGVLTLTPSLLVLSQARSYLRERPLSRDGVLTIALLLVATSWVFLQSRYPILFLIPPMMLLVAWRQEVIGGVIGATLVAAIAVLTTMSGVGPLHLIQGGAEQSLVLQLFLAVSIFVSLPVAAFQRQRRHILHDMARASEAAARSEARYRLLTENALDVVVHTGLDGRVSYISPAVLKVLGYTPEEMIGMRAIDMVHADDFDQVVALSQERVSGRVSGAPDRIEYRAYRKDGALIWLESRPTLARDPVSGEKIGITDIVRDITAQEAGAGSARGPSPGRGRRRRQGRVPGQYEPRAAHAPDGRDRLRQSGRGSARTVDRHAPAGQPDPGRRRSLLATIDDILDFSKLDAGLLEFKPRGVVVADLVREVLDIFTPTAEDKGLTLKAEWLDGLPRDLWLDPERLRQVLMNLVGNAIKFTETGGVILRLTHDAGARRLNFEIRDTGRGIAAEDLPLLFMRFSQLDVSISRQHGGAGLGLAICRGWSS
jgi:PAS domain S-box-containing protein